MHFCIGEAFVKNLHKSLNASIAIVIFPHSLDFSRDISYNLDVIISVGYRVKSRQGTMFRILATQRLRDYIIRGYALNEERFKKGSSMNYFKELIEKVYLESIKELDRDIKGISS